MAVIYVTGNLWELADGDYTNMTERGDIYLRGDYRPPDNRPIVLLMERNFIGDHAPERYGRNFKLSESFLGPGYGFAVYEYDRRG